MKLKKIIKYALLKNRLNRPISLIFFVTNRCNLRCKHCFYWQQLKKNVMELNIKTIEKFSQQLGRLTDVSLSGGEPMLRRDLPEIYKIFAENNKPESFTIPTNGTFPTLIKKHVKQILSAGYDTKINIALSLDGPKELHDKIRGKKGTYDKVFKTYKQLEQFKEHINIRVATVLNNKNIPFIPQLINDVQTKMPFLNFHNFEIIRGNPRNPSQEVPNIDTLKKIRPLIFKTMEKYSFFGKGIKSRMVLAIKKYAFDSYIKTLDIKKNINPCYVDKTHCVIDYNGDISFCELLEPIGNIKKNTLPEILNSEEAKSQKEMIHSCYCTHSCFQQKNIILNPFNYPKILTYLK